MTQANCRARVPDEMTASVRQRLLETQRRLTAQRSINGAVWTLPTFLIVPTHYWISLSFLILGAVAIAAFLNRPTLPDAARWLDLRASTRDRFRTALDFATRPHPTSLEQLAAQECETFARDFRVQPWTTLRLPRLTAWIVAPLLALAFFSWRHVWTPPTKPTALQIAVNARADSLQKIARDLRAEPKPELARVAAAMDESARRLKAETPSDDEARLKSALREMSSLEAMLRAVQAAHDQPVSAEELAALAEALAASDATRPAAESMKSGDLGNAASKLDALAQQMRERGDPALPRLSDAMREQTAKLTDAQKNAIAREMQSDAAQGASSNALERLAQMLQQAGQNGGASKTASAGRPATDREIQSLLDALSELKAGLRPGSPKDGGASALAGIVQGKNDTTAASAGTAPSGQAGSEHDTGHSEHVLASAPIAEAPKPAGPAAQLQGAQGQGESLETFMSAAGDRSRATRAYRENYERLAPAEQNAVEQENIPLGARAFVRRYFENIRPTE